MAPEEQIQKKIPRIIGWNLLKCVPALFKDPLETTLQISKKYGDILEFYFNEKKRFIIVNHPDFVFRILKENADNYPRNPVNFAKFDPVNKLLLYFLGEGIFVSEGKKWELQHTNLKPAFHEEQVRKYYRIIKEETEDLILRWRKKAHAKESVLIEADINLLLLKIMIKTQFSTTVNIDYLKLSQLVEEVIKGLSIETSNMNYVRKMVNTIFRLRIPIGVKAKSNLEELEKMVETIITAAESEGENAGYVLMKMIEARNKGELAQSDLRDMIMNFLFAGFDTTATGITWTCQCLSANEEEQNKTYSEIKNALGDRVPHIEDLQSMPYLKMVIQEALRLYTPVWSLTRVSVKEDVINGYPIPRGSYIMISLYSLHRHPDFWERPYEFYPERFNPDTFKGKAFVYLPFGQGKRMCIGKPLAMTEMQLILPMLLKEFRFINVVKNPVLDGGIIIKAKKPLLVKLEARS